MKLLYEEMSTKARKKNLRSGRPQNEDGTLREEEKERKRDIRKREKEREGQT